MSETLAAGPAELTIDLEDGGRLSSFRLAGRELLYHAGDASTMHGSFVMAPYAGRIRDGRFSVGGRDVQLPLSLPPHAAHGLVLDRPWTLLERNESSATLMCVLDERWPGDGRVVQQLTLTEAELVQEVRVEADAGEFPASVGWHPWFRRHLAHAAPAGIELHAAAMLVRDADYITTRRRMAIPPGPWDDCFVDVSWPVTLDWPGLVRLEISADTRFVVVFDEGDVSICVEPQTSPPDALNHDASVVRPGRPLRARMEWRWLLR